MNTDAIEFLKTHINWNISEISSFKRIGGLSSENYKVTYKDKEYFLKICPYSYLHTDRYTEMCIINKAAKKNISPTLYYYSLDYGNMLSHWLNGNMPSEADFSSINFLSTLSKKLKELHNLSCEKYFYPFNHIRERINICKDFNLPLPSSMDILLENLNTLEEKLSKNISLGLCHNDLNVSNMIISDDNLFFVDYEYSSMGDIFFDLATVSWFLNEDCRKQLIIQYFNEYKEEYYEKLLDYLFVVKFYNATWSLLKSTDSNSEYDYLTGAKIIFDDLLNHNSIRNF